MRGQSKDCSRCVDLINALKRFSHEEPETSNLSSEARENFINKIDDWVMIEKNQRAPGTSTSTQPKIQKVPSFLRQRAPGASTSTQPKIQKVPAFLRQRDQQKFEKYYEPRWISIGPIHHGKPNLQLAEKYKLKWTAKFIANNQLEAKRVYGVIEDNIEELKECFDEEVIKDYDDGTLSLMLFMDGCSILLLMQRCSTNKHEDLEEINLKGDQALLAKKDLFLLENQIPFRVLNLVMDLLTDSSDIKSSMRKFIGMSINIMVPPVREENNKGKNRSESNPMLTDLSKIKSSMGMFIRMRPRRNMAIRMRPRRNMHMACAMPMSIMEPPVREENNQKIRMLKTKRSESNPIHLLDLLRLSLVSPKDPIAENQPINQQRNNFTRSSSSSSSSSATDPNAENQPINQQRDNFTPSFFSSSATELSHLKELTTNNEPTLTDQSRESPHPKQSQDIMHELSNLQELTTNNVPTLIDQRMERLYPKQSQETRIESQMIEVTATNESTLTCQSMELPYLMHSPETMLESQMIEVMATNESTTCQSMELPYLMHSPETMIELSNLQELTTNNESTQTEQSKESPHPKQSQDIMHANQRSFRGAGELKKAGIYFRQSKKRYLVDAVKFIPKCISGRLELPQLTVDDSTAPKFLNLIAYEMCPDVKTKYEVSAYISFLDRLIDYPNDVKELRKSRVLLNDLGSDEEVADLFNEISTDLVVNLSIYQDVIQNIEEHYNSKMRTWMAQVYHDHFSSPWTIVAFLAALAVIVMTIIQTWRAFL